MRLSPDAWKYVFWHKSPAFLWPEELRHLVWQACDPTNRESRVQVLYDPRPFELGHLMDPPLEAIKRYVLTLDRLPVVGPRGVIQFYALQPSNRFTHQLVQRLRMQERMECYELRRDLSAIWSAMRWRDPRTVSPSLWAELQRKEKWREQAPGVQHGRDAAQPQDTVPSGAFRA